MKKLILTGKLIAILIKVKDAGFPFYEGINTFLEDNAGLPEDESVELKIEDDDEFDDIVEMITQYLAADSLSEEDAPTEAEKVELQEFLEQLSAIEEYQEEDDDEEIDDDDEIDNEEDEEETIDEDENPDDAEEKTE